MSLHSDRSRLLLVQRYLALLLRWHSHSLSTGLANVLLTEYLPLHCKRDFVREEKSYE